MVASPTDSLLLRGIVIVALALLSGFVADAVLDDEFLPALVVAIVLLVLVVLDARARSEAE